MNLLAEGTLIKLTKIRDLIAGSNELGDLIEYSDNYIDLVINHDHDKNLLIDLLTNAIAMLNDMKELAGIAPGGHFSCTCDINPQYNLYINFIKEKTIEPETPKLNLLH